MSLFLLQLEEWEPEAAREINPAFEDEQEEGKEQQFIARANETVFREMRRHRNYANIATFEDRERTRHCMVIQFPGFSRRGLLSFNYNKLRRTSCCSVDILDSSGGFLKSGTPQQTIQLCRALVNNELYSQLLCKIGVCMGSGQLKLQIPYFLLAYTHILDYTYEKHCESAVLIIFKRFVEKYLPFLNSILKILLPPEIRVTKTAQETELLSKVYKYCDMICVSSHLSESFLETEKETISKHHSNELSIRRMTDSKMKGSMPSTRLFVQTMQEPKFSEDYRLNNEELKMIQALIAMPFQPRSMNPYQNTVVLNHILMHEPQNIQLLTRINQGGFSSIYITQLNFWYVESSEGYESYVRSDNLTMRKLLQKWVVVKQQEGRKKGKRTAHEVNILKNIKNGCSVFLPKYYIPVNQPNPYPNSIIIDFINYHNLSQFLVATKPTISLVSKLYVMFSLVQALRYLRDYKIVHLDLKPQNIMLYANYLVKLVDFGESYHPQVCSKNHKPGFTPPYSCPQTFQSGANFTAKSDVYSIGVLFFQILYGFHPFEIDERVSVKKGMQQYLKRWIFAPQEYENYGDNTVLRILNNLINKCVSVRPEERPELDWLAVVLRFCFELIS